MSPRTVYRSIERTGHETVCRSLPHARLGNTLEESERLRAVAHQYILGLLIMVEHHFVVLSADTGLLVAAKSRMRWIRMVAIGPHTACLDASPEAIGQVEISGPDTRTQTIQSVVGNLERLFRRIEDRDRHHGAEYFLL